MCDNDEYTSLKNWLDSTRDEPLESMDGFFSARIDGYEEHMSPWTEYYKWLARVLPDGITTLLDLGCGTGLELDRIFERFPYLEVTGVDLSRIMLDKLRSKHGDRRLNLVCADYFVCELGENCFDAAVSVESLHHFSSDSKAALFAKLYRALKPGGVYIECDYIAQSREIEELTFAECARRRERDGIPPEVFVHFDTPLTLQHEIAALKAGGFEQVETIGTLPRDPGTVMLRAVRSRSRTDE